MSSQGIAVVGNQAATAVYSGSDLPSSDVVRQASHAHCLIQLAASDGTLTGKATNVGPIADGWRIDKTGNFVLSPLCKFLLLGGADLHANIQTVSSLPGIGSSQTETWNIATGTGQFLADVLFALSAGDPFDDILKSSGVCGLGLTSRAPLRNRATFVGNQDAVPTTQNGIHVSTLAAIGRLTAGASDFAWRGIFNNFTATGFDVAVDATGAPGTDQVAVMGLSFGGNNFAINNIDSPISAAADWVVTDPGFEPGAVLMVGSQATIADVGSTLADQAFAYGMHASDGTVEGSVSWHDLSEAPTTDSGGYTDQIIIGLQAPDGDLRHNLKNLVFEATGWRVAAVDIAAADPASREWLYLAIETAPAAGTVVPIVPGTWRWQGAPMVVAQPTLVTVAPGTWRWQGALLELEQAQAVETLPGTWRWQGALLTVAQPTLIEITPGIWRWQGGLLEVEQPGVIIVTPGTWRWQGQAFTVGQPTLVTVTPGSWRWSGAALELGQLLELAPGTWRWSGSALTVRQTAPIDILRGFIRWRGNPLSVSGQLTQKESVLLRQIEADMVPVYFDRAHGFAEDVIAGGMQIKAIIDRESTEGGDRDGPRMLVQTTDAVRLARRARVFIDGEAWIMEGSQPDGTGISELILTREV